jgi:large exoprotein involved in heme utilization and adhesion
VTGGEPSSINGAIYSKIAGANVYLINPWGVVFGTRGSVNVSGSFYASTANYIKMANGARFRATNPRASTLTPARPAAFGFLESKPAAITVDGSTLTARGTIGLVGGAVSVRDGATIQAPGGTIDVVAVAGKGEAPVNPRARAALTIRRFGRATIAGGSSLNAGNPSGRGHAGSVFVRSGSLVVSASAIEADNYGPGAGGDIVIKAGSLAIENGGVISAGTSGTGKGGDISVDISGRLMINGAGTSAFTGIAAQAVSSSSGSAGDIFVSAGSLSIAASGEISAGTFGPGAAGDVSVHVARRLTVNGAGSTALTGIDAQANPGSNGSAGDVTVAAGTLIVAGGGEISGDTFGAKNAGIVTVSAGTLHILGGGEIASDTFGAGGGGDLRISAGSLSIGANGAISAGAFGAGKGGDISVDVAGRLVINGQGKGGFTGIAAQANRVATGAGGNVRVAAETLVVVNGGEISAATFGTKDAGTVSVSAGALSIASGGVILAAAEAGSFGNAGDVTVKAEALSIKGGGEISASTSGTGAGGKVTINVLDQLKIVGTRGNSFTGIAAQANQGSTNDAGEVFVEAGSLFIFRNGEISANTSGSGDAGKVSVRIADLLTINGKGGDPSYLTGIAAQANKGSTGRGGSVTVLAAAANILDNGEITSSTFGSGRSGSVTVGVSGQLTISGAHSDPNKLTGITSEANPGSKGSAGDVFVRAGSLSILDEGEISSGTFGSGKGGDVSVAVRGRLVINGAGSNPRFLTGITSGADRNSTGDAGEVRVKAGELTIVRNGEIGSGTFGSGSGGEVVVDVAGRILIDARGADPRYVTGIATQANPGSTNNAGDVMVRAGTLSLLDGGAIESAAIGTRNGVKASSGNAGKVVVVVAGQLVIAGARSKIATTTDSGTVGNAGVVTVGAGRISIADGGGILSTTAGSGAGGSVTVTTPGALVLDGSGTEIAASAAGRQSGPAGTVMVSAGSLTIAGGAEIASSAAGLGPGGGITVSVSSDIVLTGPNPVITAQSTGSGNAGTIAISASRLFLNDGATISTEAEAPTANGGNIVLSLGDLLYLTAGEITTSVHGRTGNGGNIALTAPFVILDHSDVIAQAIAGHGGNITIDAGQYIPSFGSIVSASSELGVSGTVVVSGPLVDLNGTLVVMSSELRNPAALSRDSCAARAGRPQSSLYEAGRGGLPADPTENLPALYLAGRDIRLGPPVAAPRAAAVGDFPSTLESRLHCG